MRPRPGPNTSTPPSGPPKTPARARGVAARPGRRPPRPRPRRSPRRCAASGPRPPPRSPPPGSGWRTSPRWASTRSPGPARPATAQGGGSPGARAGPAAPRHRGPCATTGRSQAPPSSQPSAVGLGRPAPARHPPRRRWRVRRAVRRQPWGRASRGRRWGQHRGGPVGILKPPWDLTSRTTATIRRRPRRREGDGRRDAPRGVHRSPGQQGAPTDHTATSPCSSPATTAT